LLYVRAGRSAAKADPLRVAIAVRARINFFILNFPRGARTLSCPSLEPLEL
jgi:hypothetical protein